MTGDATFTGNLTVTNVRATNVYVTGFVASNGYITYSDERYKLDVSAIPYGIDEIMQLNPVSYRYISHPDVVSLGFIAQEAMSVIPESVVMNPEGYYGMFYANLIPVLVKAIQDQEIRIVALEKDPSLQAKIVDKAANVSDFEP